MKTSQHSVSLESPAAVEMALLLVVEASTRPTLLALPTKGAFFGRQLA